MKRFRSFLYRIMSAILAISMIVQTIPAQAIAETLDLDTSLDYPESITQAPSDDSGDSDDGAAGEDRQSEDSSGSQESNVSSGEPSQNDSEKQNQEILNLGDTSPSSSPSTSETSASWNQIEGCEWLKDDAGNVVLRTRGAYSPGYEPGVVSSELRAEKVFGSDITSFQVEGSVNVEHLMFANCSKLKEVNLKGLCVSGDSLGWMFYKCSNLISVNLSDLKIGPIDRLGLIHLFDGCSNLQNVNLGSLDTSGVFSTENMFVGCSSLLTLDLKSLDTHSVRTMKYMFYSCSKLRELDLTSFETLNTTDMTCMFLGCCSLNSIRLSSKFSFKQISKENERPIFPCNGDTGRWISSVDAVAYEANGIPSSVDAIYTLQNDDQISDCWNQLDTCKWKVDSNDFSLVIKPLDDKKGSLILKSYFDQQLWRRYSSKLSNVRFIGDVSVSGDFSYVFCQPGGQECNSLESVDFGELDTSGVANFNGLFYGCPSLNKIKIGKRFVVDEKLPANKTLYFPSQGKCSGFWKSSLDSISYYYDSIPFGVAATYTAVKLSQHSDWVQNGDCLWKIDSQGTLFIKPISGTSGALSDSFPWINYGSEISAVDIEGRVIMPKRGDRAFSNLCNVGSIDLSNVDFSSCSSLEGLFFGCTDLKKVNFGGNTLSSVTNMSNMFRNCSSLSSFDFKKITGEKVTDASYMFYECPSLESIVFESFDSSHISSCAGFFPDWSKLSSIEFSSSFSSRLGMELPTYYLTPSGKWIRVNWYDSKGQMIANDEVPSGICERIIAKSEIDLSYFNVDTSSEMYTGKQIVKTIKCVLGLDSENYDVVYSNNLNVGQALITIRGKCLLSGDVSFTFNIIKSNGGCIPPTGIKAVYGQTLHEVILPEGFVWENTDQNVGDPGNNVFKCRWLGDDNHEGANGIEVKVCVTRPADPSMFEVASDGIVYTGKAIEPAISSSIIPRDSYEVSYRDNVDAGTAAVVIKGKGFYTGSCEIPFNISKAKPSFEVPTDIKATYGKKLSDVQLPDGFSWRDPDVQVGDPGENAFQCDYAAPNENHTGVQDIEVKVRVTRPVDASMFEVASDGLVYSGKALEPAVSSSVVPSDSYEVSYRDNVNAGKATAVIKGKGFYTGSCEVPFQIAKAKPSYEVPTGIKATYGQKLSDVKLPDGFSWQDPDTIVDWYGFRTVKAVFSSSDSRNYERVTDIDINVFTGRNIIAVPKVEDITFNGSQQAPDIHIDGVHVVKNDGGCNVGSYTVQIALDDPSVDTWNDGSTVDKTISYQIVPADISTSHFEEIAPCLLKDGKAEPAVSGSFNGISLNDGSDFSVSYKDNTVVGVGSAVVDGRGNFKGSKTLKFRIAKGDLKDYHLSLRQEAFLYKDAPIEPRVWVTGDGASKSLRQGVDFTVSYSDNDHLGTGHIIVQGIGDYFSTNSIDFDIVDSIDLNKYCNARCDNALYDGSAVSPSVYVSLKTEGYDEAFGNAGASRCLDAPVEGRDFTVSYENNEAPGMGTAIISGYGRYSGVLRVNFNILRKSSVDLAECTVDIEPSGDFSRFSYGYGNQLEFAYTGSEIKPRVKVSYFDSGVIVTLKQDVDYRLSYSSNVSPGSAAIDVSGINGVCGSKRARFNIVRKIPISDLVLSVSDLAQSEYVLVPGFSVAPKLKSYPDFIEGADYKLTYKDCDKVGNGVVTVTGIGRFTGSIDISVPIVSSLDRPLLSSCSIDVIPDQTYTGSAIYPRVSIHDPSGIAVDTSRECSISYSNNVNVGKANVIVGEKAGFSSSYLGSLYSSFNIVAADIGSADFSPISSQVYSGNTIEPTLNLTYKGKALTKGVDYDVSYSDNVKVGVAHGLIVGKGNFTGQRSFTFDIKSPQMSFAETMTEGKTSFASWSSGINTTRFRILMDEGGMVSISTRFSGLESVLCSIRNAQGDIVYSWAPRDGQVYGYFALPAGTYYFEYFGSVSSYFGTVSASYACDSFWTSSDTVYEVEDNSGSRDGHTIESDATPIQIGTLFAGSNYNTITGYGDLDYFKFTVTDESLYSMLLMTSANLIFALEDSSGKVLLNSDTGESLVGQTLNGQSAGLDFGSLKPGTYYVLVLSKDQTAVGKPYFGCVRESGQPAMSQGGVDRVSGNTRYETMGSLSKRGNWGWGGTAILSSGANYPDALAASSLAGGFDAPILLTDPTVLSDACKQELDWLRPSALYIVGGSLAVSDVVESQVRSLLGSGCAIHRIAGETRYETSLAVAKANPAHSDTVVVATGLNYADALSISPYAFASGSPVILCDSSNGLIDEAVNSIRGGGYSKAVIVGGYSAVPKGVERQLTLAGVDSVTRLSGTTRYETSIKISDFELASGLGFSMDGALFATGSNFPDALAAGPLAGRMRSPLLLVDSGAGIVSGYLSTHKGEVKSATVVGGVNAIPESDKRQLERALNI